MQCALQLTHFADSVPYAKLFGIFKRTVQRIAANEQKQYENRVFL